jgi:hypothetical protein
MAAIAIHPGNHLGEELRELGMSAPTAEVSGAITRVSGR